MVVYPIVVTILSERLLSESLVSEHLANVRLLKIRSLTVLSLTDRSISVHFVLLLVTARSRTDLSSVQPTRTLLMHRNGYGSYLNTGSHAPGMDPKMMTLRSLKEIYVSSGVDFE
jgi:hypothetical protein